MTLTPFGAGGGSTGGLLSQNRPATASSTENASFPASNAYDGNTGTRWSSQFSDPQWIQVDLGAVHSVNRVRLTWEAAFGSAYQIQTSTDGGSWSTAYATSAGQGGVEDLSFGTRQARYIRMQGTQRGTPYGYSLWEMEVYGS
ncbi:discoidin domain-containing protein [Fodinicola feengrottensis]|uniref:discoidin domain-containing protein n=1 Tax=Fodinicola feengrottensis TaxID=435914 RepID=UPI002441AD82|nr:discoidin domain-containing protein [Fodinicola feengrottensis]